MLSDSLLKLQSSHQAEVKWSSTDSFYYVTMWPEDALDHSEKDEALKRKLAEYLFYTNIGNDMASIMKAFRYVGGVKGKIKKF